MDKQTFISIVEKLKKQYEDANEWWDDIERVFGSGASESAIEHSAFSLVIDTLEVTLNDTEHWLSYWFFETDRRTFTIEQYGAERVIKNLSQLYELITK